MGNYGYAPGSPPDAGAGAAIEEIGQQTLDINTNNTAITNQGNNSNDGTCVSASASFRLMLRPNCNRVSLPSTASMSRIGTRSKSLSYRPGLGIELNREELAKYGR